MKLSELSFQQLNHVYTRLYRRVRKDVFGCDWNTLRITNLSLYNSLRSVHKEMILRGKGA